MEPIQQRHLKVKQGHIRFPVGAADEGFRAGGGFAADFHAGDLLQQFAQNLAGDRFVVGDQDACHAAPAWGCLAARGMRKPTV